MCTYVCISIAFALENTAGGAVILATLEWTDGQQNASMQYKLIGPLAGEANIPIAVWYH